ncbi:MAG: hypothetical protein IT313_10970 [Anaerolineales bacterium]|nr:hypothetical protein [Anaerolineales bacterium]
MNFLVSPSTQSHRGQGLVEYAIIISLVAIVVVAVVLALGPKVGNTFSGINNSLNVGMGSDGGSDDDPGPGDSGDWTFAANENDVVSVPTGVYQVQYGANGQYYYQYFTGPTSVTCNNATFGDPIVGIPKNCSLRKQN